MEPANIWDIDMSDYVAKNYLKEVTSMLVYEPSSKNFHPEGLYSEQIFGEIGSSARMGTLGYINLGCQILSPLSFINVTNVSSWYKDILESRVHVYFDPKKGDFIPCDKEDKNAHTGFQYFIDHVHLVKFERNESLSRTNRIEQLERAFANRVHLWDKYLVCPAGWRDVRKKKDGRDEIDDVNKLYTSLLAMSRDMKSVIMTPELMNYFDLAKYHIQLKALEIFQYWKTFFEGKSGYGQGYYIKRRLALGTRNVITSATMNDASPKDPGYIKHNETQVPVYQAAKAMEPAVIHVLNSIFYYPVYTQGSVKVAAVDKETLEQVYIEVTPSQVTYALSSKSKKDFINSMADEHIRQTPVTITDIKGKEYYLYLVYDLGDSIYIFRGISEFKRELSEHGIMRKVNDGSVVDGVKVSDCPIIDEKTLDNLKTVVTDTYKSKYAIDFINNNHVLFKLSDTPIGNDGNVVPPDKLDYSTYRGCYCNAHNTVYINPYFREVLTRITGIRYVKTVDDFFQYVCNLIAHELAHYIWQHIATDDEKNTVLERATNSSFNTPYLETFTEKNTDEYKLELFCEWIAYSVMPPPEKMEDPEYQQNGIITEIDVTKIHPLTKIEMLYLTVASIEEKYCTTTRYPVLNVGSIYPSVMVPVSTSPGRTVLWKSQTQPEYPPRVYPHYPRYGVNTYFEGLIIHPSKTINLGADYDGDKLSMSAILTKEGIAEAKRVLASPESLISPSLKFHDSLNTMTIGFTIHALMRVRPDVTVPEIED